MTDIKVKDIVRAVVRKVDDEHILGLLHAEQSEAVKAMMAEGGNMRVKPSKNSAEIIQAIRDKEPDKIDERIYFFPLGNYNLITDKGYPFSLPLIDNYTPDEMAEIHSIRLELMARYRKEDKQAYEDYKTEAEDKLSEIEDKRKARAYCKVNPLSGGKQIRIYISASNAAQIEKLGYKVMQQERESNYAIWNEDKQAYEDKISKVISYSFIMNFRAYISACKSGKIPPKGYLISDGGEMVQIKQSGVRERIRVRDAEGVIREFVSKTEAARELGISPALLTKLIKANPDAEILEVKVNAKDNRKGLVLINPEGERLEFESVTDAAKNFNTNKMKISRLIKGKVSGDIVSLLGSEYRIG